MSSSTPLVTLGSDSPCDFTFEKDGHGRQHEVRALQTELAQWKDMWVKNSGMVLQMEERVQGLEHALAWASGPGRGVGGVGAGTGVALRDGDGRQQAESAVKVTDAAAHAQPAAHAAAQSALGQAQRAEQTARRLVRELLAQNKILTVSKDAMESMHNLTGAAAHDRGVQLENTVAQLQTENAILKADAQRQRDAVRKANQDRLTHETQLSEQDATLQEHADLIARLRRDGDVAREATAATTSLLDRTYADLHDAIAARQAAHKARDDADARHRDVELRFNDLHAEWDASQRRVELLESQLDAMALLERENAALQTDMDTLHEQLADHDRALLVKDERIRHLESQFQQERQTHMRTAAAMASGAASPVNEPPESVFSNMDSLAAESLWDELEGRRSQLGHGDDDNDDMSLFGELDFSTVVELVSVEPVQVAQRQHRVSGITMAGSVAPVTPVLAPLTISVGAAARVTPVTPVPAPLTINVSETARVAPVTPVFAPLTTNITEAACATPVSPALAPLTITVDEATSVAPMERQITPLTTVVPQHAIVSTTPTVPAPMSLAMHMIDGATVDVSPVDVEQQKLTMDMIGSATVDVSPVDVEQQRLTTNMVDCATFDVAPVDVEQQKLTTNMVDVATLDVAPLDVELPEQPKLTMDMIDSATLDVAPHDVEIPQQPKLTTNMVNSATLDVSPLDVEQPEQPTLTMDMIDGATLDMPPLDVEQQKQPKLTTNMIDGATVDMPPLDVDLPEKQRLTANMVNSATLDVSPLDIEQPQHHKLTLQESKHASIQVVPQEPEYLQLDRPKLAVGMVNSAIIDHAPIKGQEYKQSIASVQTDNPKLSISMVDAATEYTPIDAPQPKNKQTRDWVSQTRISNPTLKITPFIATPDEWPLEIIVRKRPTSDSTVQTDAEVAPRVKEAAPASYVTVMPQNKLGLSHWILQLLIALLMLLVGCLIHVRLRLSAWETANGHGQINSYSQGGAFGNGRYLFGFIPVAMGIGNSDLFEQFSRFTSMFIAQWAGPHVRNY